MQRIVRFLFRLSLSGLVVLFCVSRGGSQNGDSVDIESVVGKTAPLANTIIAGQPFVFEVQVRYALVSANNAYLQIAAEEYPKSAGGCKGDVHETNGQRGKMIPQGTGRASMTATWQGDHPVYAGGGYITLWFAYADSPQFHHLYAVFRGFTQYCYAFVPLPRQRID